MKTMLQSMPSRLSGPARPFEELSVADMIDDVDRRVRIMCRMMELYSYNTGRKNAEDEGADLAVAVCVFYEYVDRQMDTLSALSAALADEGHMSLKTLRGRSDGR
ncbi:MAG: hypothetical protein ACOH2J_20795 [Allorhizobium sp.]